MLLKKLNKNIDKLNRNLTNANLIEILSILGNRRQMIIRNIWAGIGRGIGIGIGVTIITAIIVYLLRKIVMLNIPIIGEYIADIIEIVESKKF